MFSFILRFRILCAFLLTNQKLVFTQALAAQPIKCHFANPIAKKEIGGVRTRPFSHSVTACKQLWILLKCTRNFNLGKHNLKRFQDRFGRIITASKGAPFPTTVHVGCPQDRGVPTVVGIACNAYPQNFLCLKCLPTNLEILLHIRPTNDKNVNFFQP